VVVVAVPVCAKAAVANKPAIKVAIRVFIGVLTLLNESGNYISSNATGNGSVDGEL
jgi:hypothetical protein